MTRSAVRSPAQLTIQGPAWTIEVLIDRAPDSKVAEAQPKVTRKGRPG